MRAISRLIARGLSAAALLIAFAPASMALETFTVELEETVSCPSEDIYLMGTGRFQFHEVQNANHTTWIFQVFWRGEGVGLNSGAEYTLSGKWMEVIQQGAPFIFLWNDHFQLTGKKGAENYRLYWKVRIVIDPNGRPVIEAQAYDWACPNA